MAGESQSGRLIRRSRVQVPPGSLKPPDKGGFFIGVNFGLGFTVGPSQ